MCWRYCRLRRYIINNEIPSLGTVLNCKNTGHITDKTSIGDIGNIAGVITAKGKVERCIYGGTVNRVAGTRANAIGRIENRRFIQEHQNQICRKFQQIAFQNKELNSLYYIMSNLKK